MAMKLLAHVLRGAPPEAGGRATARSAESRRWVVFRDLVVRRGDSAPWGLAFSASGFGPRAERSDPAQEPLWADTQPWCHK